jgi:hypothetical protein
MYKNLSGDLKLIFLIINFLKRAFMFI